MTAPHLVKGKLLLYGLDGVSRAPISRDLYHLELVLEQAPLAQNPPMS